MPEVRRSAAAGKPRTLRPSRGTSGAGSQQRQPTVAVTIDDDAASIGAEEVDEADDAMTEADDEADDNIEDDPDIRVTVN